MFNATVVEKVSAEAKRLGIEPAALLAVCEVEAAGITEWKVGSKSFPAIRFEGHYFHRILKKRSKAKLKAAVKAGLANPNAGGVKNPKSYEARYALLDRAVAIDEDAAYESTSWGIGQVMGAHWQKLRYNSVQGLVSAAKRSVDGQIEIMVRYIEAFGLVDELQTKGFLQFALQYNGPAARKGNYDGKMQAAYARWTKALASEEPMKEATNSKITEYQKELASLGYYKGPINGENTLEYKAAVRKFQQAKGLVVDGKVGQNTDEAIDIALAEKQDAHGDEVLTKGSVGGSVATGVVETVNGAIGQTKEVAATIGSNTLNWVVVGMVMLVVAITVYGLWQKRKAKQSLKAV